MRKMYGCYTHSFIFKCADHLGARAAGDCKFATGAGTEGILAEADYM